MFNFLASCGLCSSQPNNGDYSYELYNKVPAVGGAMGNLSEIINDPQAMGRLLQHQHDQNQRQNGLDNPHQNAVMVGSLFKNNCPLQSVIAGEYTFQDLVDNNLTKAPIKQILKSNYTRLVQQLERSGESYTDLEFPPEQSSLGNVEDLELRANWVRISQVVKGAVFVNESITPSSIFQGSPTNGYFLSAIYALAQNDFRIKNIFPNTNRALNKYGVYMARIKFRGVLREVVVDDYVPVDQHGEPLFARPTRDKEVWLIILQKCWAKLHGSYGRIVGGLPGPVLQAFSGAPTYFYDMSEDRQKSEGLWAIMRDSYHNGAVMCCGTKQKADVQRYGLARGYVYTILHLYQKQYRLLKIRRHWGNWEWRGPACLADVPFWSTVSKKDQIQMGVSGKDDGVFFILWEHFIGLFDMIDICKINDNASCSSIQVEFAKKNGQILQFQVKGRNVTFTLSLDGLANNKKGGEQRYSRSIIIVGRKQISNKRVEYRYVASSSNNTFADHHIELNNLQKGSYVVYAKVDWINQTIDSATASLYSSYPVHLKRGKQADHTGFLYKVFLDHAYRYSNKKFITDNRHSWISSNMLLSQCGYGYLVFHLGKDSNVRLSFEINENQYTDQRFVLKKPYRGRGIIKASLEAGKELIILFRIKSQQYPSFIKMPVPKVQIYRQQSK